MSNTHLRLQVLQKLCAHLEGITIINGYQHDLIDVNGTHVFRGRAEFGDNDPTPMVSLIEAKATDYGVFADENSSVRKDEWVVLVQGWAVDTSKGPRGTNLDHPTDAVYQLLMDVESRLSDIVATDEKGQPKFPGKFRLEGLITSLRLASPVVRPAETGVSSKAFFYLPIRIGLAYDLTAPWQPAKLKG